MAKVQGVVKPAVMQPWPARQDSAATVTVRKADVVVFSTHAAGSIVKLPTKPAIGTVVVVVAAVTLGVGEKVVITPATGGSVNGAGTLDLEDQFDCAAVMHASNNAWVALWLPP